MTDRLGEALARYDAPGYAWDEGEETVVAAARAWHTLTKGETTERLTKTLHRRWYCRNAQPCQTCQADAAAILDVLLVTPTPEEDSPTPPIL